MARRKVDVVEYLLPLPSITVTPDIRPGTPEANKDGFISFHYGDTHFPFQDDAALAVTLAIMQDVQPDLIVHHGDLLDCYTISKYQKDPKHRIRFQDELVMAAAHLADVAALQPDARRVLLGGNHEDRLRRLVWDITDGPAREILQLTEVETQLNWPRLLALDESGWEFSDGKEVLFEKMILKHGSTVRKHSAYSAKAEQERYSKSGMSGHTHRLGAHFTRDWNGQHGWWELGCLCLLDPDYTDDPNWQHGFAVVTWSKDRELFSVEQVSINEGRAVFRGKIYTA